MTAGDKRKRRSKHFHAPGVRGRATGVFVKEGVRKDEDDFDDLDDFFEDDQRETADELTEEDDGQPVDDAEQVDEPQIPDDVAADAPDMDVSADSQNGSAVLSPLDVSQPQASSTPTVSTPKKKLQFTPDAVALRKSPRRAAKKATPQNQSARSSSHFKSPAAVDTAAESASPIEEDSAESEHDANDESEVKPRGKRTGKGAGKTASKRRAVEPSDDEDEQEPEPQPASDGHRDDSEPDSHDDDDHEANEEGDDEHKTKRRRRGPSKRGARTELLDIPVNLKDGRPKRNRVAPVKFWKNERVLYTQEEIAGRKTGVMVVKGVEKHDTPIQKARPHTRKAAHQPSRLQHAASSQDVAPQVQVVEKEKVVYKDDLLKKKLPSSEVVVRDWSEEDDNATTMLEVAKTWPMNQWKDLKEKRMRFCKTFSMTEDRWSAGLVELEPGASKGLQNTKGNFLVFHIARGKVEVTINETVLALGTGSSFQVPPTNAYDIKNVGDYSCRLFFTQVKQLDA